jgi:hypothetical protein
MTSLQISMQRVIEHPENLFKALIFCFFLIKQKEQTNGSKNVFPAFSKIAFQE